MGLQLPDRRFKSDWRLQFIDTIQYYWYGGRGEVVNASDCGSDIRGFDSPRSPHIYEFGSYEQLETPDITGFFVFLKITIFGVFTNVLPMFSGSLIFKMMSKLVNYAELNHE